MDLDDFRIPDTSRPERSMKSLPAPRSAPASANIVGLGVNTQLASSKRLSASATRTHELDVDTRSTSPIARDEAVSPAPRKMPASASQLRQRDKGVPRTSYFSALTQKFQQRDHNGQTRTFSSTHTHTSGSQNAVRLSGEVVSYPGLAARNDRPGSQSWDIGHQHRNTQQSSHSQSGDVYAGFRGIQDAIATKFQDLEKKLQLQEQEITELRFSLNDANVTADLLDADKRQLKQKNEELERKLTQSDSTRNKLQDDIRGGKEELRAAVEKHNQLSQDAEEAQERAARNYQLLLDARKTTDVIRTQLDESRRELRETTVLSIEKNRQAEEKADAKVQDLAQQLQRRDADVQAQKDANERLAYKLDSIPERNFQALTTCVKKIIEKVDDSRSEILADGKAVNKQHQEQHGAMVECLKGLLTASQQHVEALAKSQQETEVLSKHLLDKIEASDSLRNESESSLRSEVTNGMCDLQKNLENYHTSFRETFAVKIRESDILAEICQKREDDNSKLSNQLSEQSHISREQLNDIRELHQALKNLEIPREDPKMVAKILALQEQSRHFDAELKEKEVLVTSLEESYKERTKSLISSSEKFASDIQQLNNTFHKREEEYRRAVDQASELAIKEARRTSDENKQETKRELQQERARRQSLERELRQAKEDLSVTEEKSRRSGQSNEALLNELATAKLGNQAVTVHLEEKTRALEHRLDRDATLITQLKAALAAKEMDYVNLRGSMEAYDEKVRVLIGHLRVWAQDYTHIGAIRSRLEMLGQIDQSCAATARIREAEQIDNVLAQLRHHYARQNERDSKLDFRTGHSQAVPMPLHHGSDEDHEQRVSDLSAFLDAEVAECQTTGHAMGGTERWSSAIQAAILGGGTDSLKTPGNGPPEQSSGMKPPPVLKDRVINVALDPKSGIGPLSSPVILSPVPKRPRRETRSTAVNNAALRNPVSPTGTRRAKRKRPDTAADSDNAGTKPKKGHTEASVYFQGGGQGEASATVISDENQPATDMMAGSPPLLIKIEDS